MYVHNYHNCILIANHIKDDKQIHVATGIKTKKVRKKG